MNRSILTLAAAAILVCIFPFAALWAQDIILNEDISVEGGLFSIRTSAGFVTTLAPRCPPGVSVELMEALNLPCALGPRPLASCTCCNEGEACSGPGGLVETVCVGDVTGVDFEIPGAFSQKGCGQCIVTANPTTTTASPQCTGCRSVAGTTCD